MAISIPSPVPESDGDGVAGLRVTRRRSRVMESFLGRWTTRVAIGFLVLAVAVAILAPLLATHAPTQQDLGATLQGPGRDHWLGTDPLGRDIFSRIVYGGRVTLLAAAQSVSIAILLGVPLGLIAGYAGRATDAVITAIADAIMALPPLILALAIVGILGAGLTNAMIAIGIVFAPRFFRVARSAAQSIVHETYIEATRAVGCTRRRIMFRHVLPNASGPLIIQITFAVGLAITAEASLSFLGLGVQDGAASWGSMVKIAFDSITTSTYGIFPPAISIAATIMAFSAIGDALRDALGGDRNDG